MALRLQEISLGSTGNLHRFLTPRGYDHTLERKVDEVTKDMDIFFESDQAKSLASHTLALMVPYIPFDLPHKTRPRIVSRSLVGWDSGLETFAHQAREKAECSREKGNPAFNITQAVTPFQQISHCHTQICTGQSMKIFYKSLETSRLVPRPTQDFQEGL